MKNLIICLLFSCAFLIVLATFSTLKLKKLKKKRKKIFYSTPKLSDLHGKAFSDYINYLTEGLH